MTQTPRHRSFTASGREHGRELIEVLADRFGLSKKAAKRLLDERVVFVNGRRIWMARHPVATGDKIEATVAERRAAAATPTPGKATPAIRVLFEDDDLLCVDKPPHALSNEGDSVESELRKARSSGFIYAVHRLDRETSGCLLFAKSAAARDAMIPLFREREVTKRYLAICIGVYRGTSRIASAIEGQPAISHVHVLHRGRDATLLDVAIETGRTHQIRRHLSSEGFPILGDKQYATVELANPVFRTVPRQMLHAATIEFDHPSSGQRVSIRAPLPADFRRTCGLLGLRIPEGA